MRDLGRVAKGKGGSRGRDGAGPVPMSSQWWREGDFRGEVESCQSQRVGSDQPRIAHIF